MFDLCITGSVVSEFINVKLEMEPEISILIQIFCQNSINLTKTS